MTVQNSLGVSGVHLVPPETVAAQVRAVVTDIGVGAAKTGMLASREIIDAVADVVDEVGIGRGPGRTPFVVDPVAASMRGDPLLAEDAMEAIRTRLFPRAELATPNLDEVRLLAGITVTDAATAREAAEALHAMGPRYVLVKGGHLRGSPEVVDLLFDGEQTWEFSGPAHRHPARPRRGRRPGQRDLRRAGPGPVHARRRRLRRALHPPRRRRVLPPRRRRGPGLAVLGGAGARVMRLRRT